jgi:hypothetical protein
MRNIDAVLDKIAEITKKGSSALIIDAYDAMRVFKPAAPEFTKFLEAYTERQINLGFDRNVASCLHEKVKTHSHWKLGSALEFVMPSTIAGYLDLYRKTYALWIQLMEKAGDLQYDFEKVKAELQWWCGLERAYTHAGLKLVRIDRI